MSSYSYKAFENFIRGPFRMLSMWMQNVSKPIWYFNKIKSEGNILVGKFRIPHKFIYMTSDEICRELQPITTWRWREIKEARCLKGLCAH